MKRNLLVVMFICILLVISCAKEQQSPVKENKGTNIEQSIIKFGEVIIKNYDKTESFFEEKSKSSAKFGEIRAIEIINPTLNKREHGILIDITIITPSYYTVSTKDARAYVDYDELESLIKGIDYIVDENNINNNSFKAHYVSSYTTKGDLKISIFPSNDIRKCVIEVKHTGLIISLNDLSKFKELVNNNKIKIEDIKKRNK